MRIARIAVTTVAFVTMAVAAPPKPVRLTPARIAELTAAADVPPPKSYLVEIWGLREAHENLDLEPTRAALPADKPEAVVECIREFRFPVAFDPPAADATHKSSAITPLTPTAFETVNTGWTIQLTAHLRGNLVALHGVADYRSVEMLPGGYGPLSGPIHTEEGQVISPNVLMQPKFQTTTTHFHLFGIPGEKYEVVLYRGAKAEKHILVLRAQ